MRADTVFAGGMDGGQAAGKQLVVLVAGGNAEAKKGVLQMARAGFDAVDAGPLRKGRPSAS